MKITPRFKASKLDGKTNNLSEVCPFGRLQRGNVKYIYVHSVLGKRDSFPRVEGCNWVKIMYKGVFGVSYSEGLVYITRQIFHLMTQIQIRQYENKYLIVHSCLLHLQKNILHRT